MPSDIERHRLLLRRSSWFVGPSYVDDIVAIAGAALDEVERVRTHLRNKHRWVNSEIPKSYVTKGDGRGRSPWVVVCDAYGNQMCSNEMAQTFETWNEAMEWVSEHQRRKHGA